MSNFFKRFVAVFSATVITVLFCIIVGVSLTDSLGSITCAIMTSVICFFFEERVYKNGSLIKTLKNMKYITYARYLDAIVLDFLILNHIVNKCGFTSLIFILIFIIIELVLFIVDKKPKELTE